VQLLKNFPALFLFLVVFHNKLTFYGEELLAPCPTPKLEDHPLLAVHDCLFNMFAATLHNWSVVKIICYYFYVDETTQEMRNGFLGNLVLGSLSNICQHIFILVKIGQQ
jgi:hypothetical protein